MRSRVLAAALLALFAGGIASDEGRTDVVPEANTHWQSPVDPTSSSALVSATHLLEFQVTALNIEGETQDPVGGLSREIVMRIDIKRIFKSDGPLPKLGLATVTLRQTGLDPMGMAPPPPIDPETLIRGETFLLDAVAPNAPSIDAIFAGARGVYPGDFGLDAFMAQQEEAGRGAPKDAAYYAHLLQLTQASRHIAHDLWGDYFLMQYRDRFYETPREAILAVAGIALDPDTNPRLAITLLADIDMEMLDHSENAELVSMLGRALLNALPRIPDPRVRSYVAARNIYGLVFDGEEKRPGRSDHFGVDALTIAAARDAISGSTDPRAKSVYQWLR
jgi:hypothetical protein